MDEGFFFGQARIILNNTVNNKSLGGMRMSVEIEYSPEVVTAYLEGEIDHHTSKDIRARIDEAVQRQKPSLLILDFRDVTFMDSSGIGLIMGRYKLLQLIGGKLRVTNVTKQTSKVMKLAGLDRLAVIEERGAEEYETKK